MKFWQKILVILASTTICERGFSKQNLIKNQLYVKLHFEILYVPTQVSLL